MRNANGIIFNKRGIIKFQDFFIKKFFQVIL